MELTSPIRIDTYEQASLLNDVCKDTGTRYHVVKYDGMSGCIIRDYYCTVLASMWFDMLVSYNNKENVYFVVEWD